MKKQTIVGLVILMGISLLGIIAVQFYWFYNSVQVRNELFDRSVNEAINKAVRRLEMGNDLKIMRNFVNPDTIRIEHGYPVPPPPPFPGSEDMEVIVKKDSLNGRITVIASNRNNQNHKRHSFRVQAFANSTGLSHIRTRKSMFVKSDTLLTNYDSVFVTELQGVNSKLGQKMEQLKKLSKAIEIEYKDWESGRHIDEEYLRKLIKEELTEKAIPIDFNFTIYPEDSIHKSEILHEDIQLYKVNLFPDDIFRKNLVLSVYFQDRNLFIGRATIMLLGLSGLFSLIIFITFALSIFLIIRQKNISEMKSDFINNMTHEFKTPIATISIAADSILDGKVIHDEDRVRFFSGMIKKENVRMNQQVERILQIARLDRKEIEFDFQEVNAHELIREAIEGILLQVEKKGGHIVTRLEATNPVITSDPIHLINLVYNLLDNANKYSPEKPVITVTTANTPKGLILSVEDQGIGMSKAVLSRIFDKFYRLPSGNVHTVKGFGLGLSYVKAILEINNGTIKVTSEPGKGSRFVFFIPFILNKP